MAEILKSKLGLPDFSLITHYLYETVNQTLISLKIPPLEKNLSLDLTSFVHIHTGYLIFIEQRAQFTMGLDEIDA